MRKLKKITALLLSGIMLFSISVPAFAIEQSSAFTENESVENTEIVANDDSDDSNKALADIENSSQSNENEIAEKEEKARSIFEKLSSYAASSLYADFTERYPDISPDEPYAFEKYSKEYGEEFFDDLISLDTLTAAKAQTYGKKSAVPVSGGYGVNVDWTFNNGVLTITGPPGPMYDPRWYTLGSPWKDIRSEITEVVIGEGITEITDYAFYYCLNLKKVTMPDSVTSIKDSAFGGCNFTEIRLSNNLTEIGDAAFSHCNNLKLSYLPDSIKTIGRYAFRRCESITISKLPDELETIDSYAFQNCDSIKTLSVGAKLKGMNGNPFALCDSFVGFTVDKNNKMFYASDGVLCDIDKTLVCYPCAKGEHNDYTVPDGTKTIADQAFAEVKLKSVYIPDSVVDIGSKAFASCSMNKLRLSNQVRNIGSQAFYENYFDEIELPDTLETIGYRAFDSVDNMYIPASVVSMDAASLPGVVEVSPDNKFYKSVDGCVYSKDGKELLLVSKEQEKLVLPSTVERIGENAGKARIYGLELNYGLKEIANNAFCSIFTSYGCGLHIDRLVIPDTVTDIGYGVFGYGFSDIRAVVFGKSVVNIDSLYLKYCELYFKGNLPKKFTLNCTNCEIFYPKGDKTWYDGALDDSDSKGNKYYTWNAELVNPVDINSCSISFSQNSFTYDGTMKKPKITIKYGSTTLKEGFDYKYYIYDCVEVGQALVIIDGFRMFKGQAEKYYTINKAPQTLSATITKSELKVNDTAQIKTSGIGKISYSSSNTSVATVNSIGLVRAVKSGTATITVKAAGDNNHNSAVKTLTVKVSANVPSPTLDKLSYSFANTNEAFGYSKTYRIPLSSYKVFFSDAEARELKKSYDSIGYWGGNCFGFSTSSMLFNVPDSTMKMTSFNANAKKVGNLKVKDYSSEYGMNLTAFLEAMLISQNTELAAYYQYYVRNDLTGLVQLIKNCDKGGPAVCIGMVNYSGGGHEIVGYKFEKVNSTTQRIYVYDCNYPNQERYITLKTNSNGQYISWSYGYFGSKYGYIDYITADAMELVWQGRQGNKNNSRNSMMTISSDKFEIQDSYGKTVAEMSDGKFSSNSDDITMHNGRAGENDNSRIIYLPTDSYHIVSFDTDIDNQLELFMSDKEQSVSVKTDSSEVDVMVDDKYGTAFANIKGEMGERYTVTVNSNLDSSKDMEELVYSGKSLGEEVTVGNYNGQVYSNNYVKDSLDINGVSYLYDNVGCTGTTDLTKCKIKTDASSYTFTGEEITPSVEVSIDGTVLTEGEDYFLVYSSNVNKGKAKVTAYGIGDFEGIISTTFNITANSISNYDISTCDFTLNKGTYTFTGNQIYADFTIKNKYGEKLSQFSDYTVEYKSNVNVGTAKATVSGKGGYTGSLTFEFYINPADSAYCDISLDKTTYIYTGKEIKPTVNVKLDGVTLTQGKQYTVEYKNNVNIGRAIVVIKGISDLSGEITKTFIISSGKDLCGDVNGDGIVDAKDRIILTRYLVDKDTYADMVKLNNADVNANGSVSSEDRAILTRYVARWKGYDSLPYKK